jgi:hypothetical protein
MSDRIDTSVKPVLPITGARSVQPVRSDAPAQRKPDVGAVTDGNLPAAYAQVVVNPDTQDLVIHVRNATTGQVITEHPTSELEAVATSMKRYAAILARVRASKDAWLPCLSEK